VLLQFACLFSHLLEGGSDDSRPALAALYLKPASLDFRLDNLSLIGLWAGLSTSGSILSILRHHDLMPTRGVVGLGSAQFRLPLLSELFRFTALQPIIL
jgi:hypothetical protein